MQCTATVPAVHCNRSRSALQPPLQCTASARTYLRHGQLPPSEVTRKVNERVVFVAAGADDTDDRLALPVNNPVVLSVAASRGYGLCP